MIQVPIRREEEETRIYGIRRLIFLLNFEKQAPGKDATGTIRFHMERVRSVDPFHM